MIRWLFEAWQRRKAASRQIFAYRVAGKQAFADPLRVVADLERALPGWSEVVQKMGHEVPAMVGAAERALAEKQRAEATVKLTEAGRAVFGLKELRPDGTGVTDAEVVGVVTAFIVYMTRLANAARPFSVA